jgi:hypothetical protein
MSRLQATNCTRHLHYVCDYYPRTSGTLQSRPFPPYWTLHFLSLLSSDGTSIRGHGRLHSSPFTQHIAPPRAIAWYGLADPDVTCFAQIARTTFSISFACTGSCIQEIPRLSLNTEMPALAIHYMFQYLAAYMDRDRSLFLRRRLASFHLMGELLNFDLCFRLLHCLNASPG